MSTAIIFAAADPQPEFLLQFILVLSMLGNLVWPVLSFVQRKSAQKREVSFSFEPASKREFDEHVASTARMFEQLATDASERRRAIYSKLDQTEKALSAEIMNVRESVAGLQKETTLLNQRSVQIDMKLDRAIENRRPR